MRHMTDSDVMPIAASSPNNLVFMATPPHSHTCPMPKEVISLSFSDSLCGPSCVQCRSPMTLALCEPDFENPTLMLATYRCAKCGLRERAQIEAAPHQRKADK